MKKQAFYSSAHAMGDLICATPTIKKLSEIYQSPITVISTHTYLFENCPYVDESLRFDDYTEEQLSEKYDLHKTFFLLGKQDSRGIEFKHAMCDIRQFHAKDLGFMLTPNELTCDYFPKSNESCLDEFNLPEKYVVIHPAQSWSSRTWSKYNWQALCISLEDAGIPVISIGKDSREESDFSGTTLKPVFKLDIKNGLDLTNKTTLDQSWHILNKANCVITMDSGVLHLAGTTDTHIIQLGSSIKSEYRAPYRNSTQDYKYSYVVGGCGLHCASDLKYSLRDWGHIQSVTLISTCLEKKPSFDCNPSFLPVVELTKKIWIGDDNITIDKQKSESFENIKPRTLVEIQSNALGDTIGAMSIIEKWRKETNKDITVISNFSDLFQTSYPSLKIINKKSNTQYLPVEGIWIVDGTPHSEKISTTYKFEVPLLEGYAQDFGITADDIELKVDLFKKERPIQSKYVCIAVQSTTQAKYWNNPGAWDELCRMFRKKGLTPVCIDKDFSFGIPGHFNEAPSKAVKKNGLSLEDTINYLYHCEMFIGLSSGLSWLAQGLQKPTVMISNVTSKDHEYIDERTLRIYEESVCHGCFHKYPFNSGDWLWCPVYRDDEQKRFICTKAITPESVMEQIEKFYKI
jgi:autotransporter strand-loop-strand O-heptosyltransferase